MGRWRTKKRCPTCNGKGSTSDIEEICAACTGRGQVPDAKAQRVDCPLCLGFGVAYRACWECKQTGFVEEGDEYCGTCSGAGEMPFATKVAREAERPYVRHLIERIDEYTRKGTQEGMVRACALDNLLHDALRQAYTMAPRRDNELFSQELRIAFGAVRVRLGQQARRLEEQSRNERRQSMADFVEALHRLRLRAQEIREELNRRYWDGLGYG